MCGIEDSINKCMATPTISITIDLSMPKPPSTSVVEKGHSYDCTPSSLGDLLSMCCLNIDSLKCLEDIAKNCGDGEYVMIVDDEECPDILSKKEDKDVCRY